MSQSGSTNASTTDGEVQTLEAGPVPCKWPPIDYPSREPLKAEDMTAEQLNKFLCTNPDCPGVKKFKEFGLGPAATGEGLGTLYGLVEVPISYGMSHTYGKFENYGPYGLYAKPKCLDQPFIPKTKLRCSTTPGCACCGTCDASVETESETETGSSCSCGTDPLRLCGGAPEDGDDKDLITPSKCPKDSTLTSACDSPNCTFSGKKYSAADDRFRFNQQNTCVCGLPACPYTKNIVGAATDEEYTKFQLLDDSKLAKLVMRCDAPKYPLPLPPCSPRLKPIPWAYPDPVPNWPCQNSQCPVKSKELPYNGRRGPLGNAQCPFATPLSCDDANCPFGLLQHHHRGQLENESEYEVCDNPHCPYSKPTCSLPPLRGSASSCGCAFCPFLVCGPPSPCVSQSVCSNSDCPYVKSSLLLSCTSPIYSPPTFTPTPYLLHICSNPACPYSTFEAEEPSKKQICNNPTCPSKKLEQHAQEFIICDNPECPFANKKSSPRNRPCADPSRSSFDKTPICNFSNCPFNPNVTRPEDNVCDDSKCPDCPRSDVSTTGDNKARLPNYGEGTSSSTKHVAEGSQQPSGACKNGKTARRCSKHREGSKSQNNKRKGCRGKYKYKLGDIYPGNHIGHRGCVLPSRNVPAKMGWLWNTWTPCVGLKPSYGWRPGAVSKTVANRIIAHRKANGLKLVEPIETSTSASKRSVTRNQSYYESDSDCDAADAPTPTLSIKKREGCYFVQMSPLKDPQTCACDENPYMDCSPMQFKIQKKKPPPPPEGAACTCEQEESSSNSELDIEFTPPAGVFNPQRCKKKKNVGHTDTQYNTKDFTPAKATKSKGGKDKKGKGKKGKT